MRVHEDSVKKILEYVKEQIAKNEISIDKMLIKPCFNYVCNQFDEKDEWTTYFFKCFFVFLGTKDGKSSIYSCEWNVSGKLHISSIVNGALDVYTNIDSIADLSINNLMIGATNFNDFYTCVEDGVIGNIVCSNGNEIIFENQPCADIKELIYLRISGRNSKIFEIKELYNIMEIIESDNEIYISPFYEKGDESQYVKVCLTENDRLNLVQKANEIKSFNPKNWHGIHTYEYKTIYRNEFFVICRFGNSYRVILDPRVINEIPKFRVQAELTEGNYFCINIPGEIKEIKEVYCDNYKLKEGNIEIQNLNDGTCFPPEELYAVKLEDGSQGLLLAYPQIENSSTEESSHKRVKSITYIQQSR